MSSVEFNCKLDLSNREALVKWRNILDYLAGNETALSDQNVDESANELQTTAETKRQPTPPHVMADLIRKFMLQGSNYQNKVLTWMEQNPGKVSAHVMKKTAELNFLDRHGALSGVFRSERWVRIGGHPDDCPFKQVAWNREKGCGIYRGITSEEAALI